MIRRSVQDCFCKIDASSRYLLSLINDILDMSKIETGKMELAHEYFDFTELMDEVNQIIYPQAEERQIRVCDLPQRAFGAVLYRGSAAPETDSHEPAVQCA